MSGCGHSFGSSTWYVHLRVLKIHLSHADHVSSHWLLFISRATWTLHVTGDVQRLCAMHVSWWTPFGDSWEIRRASQGSPAYAAPQWTLGLGWNEQNEGGQIPASSTTEKKRCGRQDASRQRYTEFASSELAAVVLLNTGGRATGRRREEA